MTDLKITPDNAALVLAVLDGPNGELAQVKARMQRAYLTHDSALHAKEAARFAEVKAWVAEAKAMTAATAGGVAYRVEGAHTKSGRGWVVSETFATRAEAEAERAALVAKQKPFMRSVERLFVTEVRL